jgi:hypothetical protein
MPDIEELVAGDLRIQADSVGATMPLKLTWRGKSNDRHPEKTLAPFFASALTTAATRHVPLELHFEELEHFNSSTITSLIQLIGEARSKGVKLLYVYNQGLKWQKLSFDAMRVFAKDNALELRSI